ncbi:MAG TPA: hypothetical protein PLY35_09380, partial [Thermotogota bacterium]|nr:hypothetical protein [Thermotogota bacterium]
MSTTQNKLVQTYDETDVKSLIKKEYLACALDPVYFIKKYCKIKHPKRGLIPFELYPFQEETLTKLRNNNRVIILKSR